MDNNLHHDHQPDSSATIAPPKTYSAEELAEIYINSRPDFLGIDLEHATRGWDDEYIYQFLYLVKEQPLIDLALEWIETAWKKKYFPLDNYCLATNISRNSAKQAFHMKLECVKVAVMNRIEDEHKEEELVRKMLEGYAENKTATGIIPASTANNDQTVEYHLADLPNDVADQMLIKDDVVYTEFVNTMKGPVNRWIGKRNLKDWNVVRFVCRLRGIVTTKCSMAVFGKLLEKMGLGNQENNMKQRTDANDRNALIAYDDPANKNQKLWKLKRDGKQIEEILDEVINSCAA